MYKLNVQLAHLIDYLSRLDIELVYINPLHTAQDIVEPIICNKQSYERNTVYVYHSVYVVRKTNRKVKYTGTTPD